MKTKHKNPTTRRTASVIGETASRTFSPVPSSVRSAIGFFGEPNLMGKSAFAALSAALLIAAPAQGALIAYEGFNYDAGNLAGNNGGTGDWDGAWAGGGTVVSGTETTAAWGGIETTGGVHRAAAIATRVIDTAFVGSSTVPLYFSAEFQKNGLQGITDNSTGYALRFTLSNNATHNSNTATIGLNKANNGEHLLEARISQGTSQSGNGFANYAYSGDGTTNPTYVGSTVLLVGKIEFNYDGTNDRLTVWADPTGIETSTLTGMIDGRDIGWVTPTIANTISFNLSNTSSPPQGDGFIDNIRIGTTWAAVVIPEPSSVALLALGGLCAFRRRR